MPTQNVYIPEPLAKELKGLDINLSRVCQVALEREVRKAKAKREAKTLIDEAVIRLRAARKEFEEEFREGHDVGTRWVAEKAGFRDLQWTMRLVESGMKSDFFQVDGSLLVSLNNHWGTDDEPMPFWQEIEQGTSYLADATRPFYQGVMTGIREMHDQIMPILMQELAQ